jgi:hypothetical protein
MPKGGAPSIAVRHGASVAHCSNVAEAAQLMIEIHKGSCLAHGASILDQARKAADQLHNDFLAHAPGVKGKAANCFGTLLRIAAIREKVDGIFVRGIPLGKMLAYISAAADAERHLKEVVIHETIDTVSELLEDTTIAFDPNDDHAYVSPQSDDASCPGALGTDQPLPPPDGHAGVFHTTTFLGGSEDCIELEPDRLSFWWADGTTMSDTDVQGCVEDQIQTCLQTACNVKYAPTADSATENSGDTSETEAVKGALAEGLVSTVCEGGLTADTNPMTTCCEAEPSIASINLQRIPSDRPNWADMTEDELARSSDYGIDDEGRLAEEDPPCLYENAGNLTNRPPDNKCDVASSNPQRADGSHGPCHGVGSLCSPDEDDEHSYDAMGATSDPPISALTDCEDGVEPIEVEINNGHTHNRKKRLPKRSRKRPAKDGREIVTTNALSDNRQCSQAGTSDDPDSGMIAGLRIPSSFSTSDGAEKWLMRNCEHLSCIKAFKCIKRACDYHVCTINQHNAIVRCRCTCQNNH